MSPDVYYAKAILWAAQQNVATGKTETTFAPLDNCPRGDSVLFLYNYFVNK